MNPHHFLSLALVAGLGAAAADSQYVDVTLSAPREKVEECKTQKCVLVTRKDVTDAITSAYKRGRDEAEEDMDSNGCKKGNT